MALSWTSYRFSGVTRIMNPQLSEALGLAGVYGAIIRPLLEQPRLPAAFARMDCCRSRIDPMAYLRLDARLAGKIYTRARRSETIAGRCRSCADDHSHYFRTDSLDALPNNSCCCRCGPAMVADRVSDVPRKRRSYFPAALVLRLTSRLLCTASRYWRHAHGAIRNSCRRRALAGRAPRSTARLCCERFRNGRLDLCNQYGRDECPCVHHARGLADRYVSAGHGSNLWSSACFCSSLSLHLAVTPPWQGGAHRTICTAEVLSHARRLRGHSRRSDHTAVSGLPPIADKWVDAGFRRSL